MEMNEPKYVVDNFVRFRHKDKTVSGRVVYVHELKSSQQPFYEYDIVLDNGVYLPFIPEEIIE